MKDSLPRIRFRLSAGAAAVAAWLVIATIVGHDRGDLFAVLAPFSALGLLSFLAGSRTEAIAAAAILFGGIVGATAVAIAAGAIGVAPSVDPAFRSSYHGMLIMIDAGIAAVVGSVFVFGGYRLGRMVTRRKLP